jgi:cyclic pyranopterin phosphate synthase
MSQLTHLDKEGHLHMVDVSGKTLTQRQANAVAHVRCAPSTIAELRSGTSSKGPVIATAELAGIMAAKRTADLIPLCHPLPLAKVQVHVELDEDLPGLRLFSEVRTNGVTGVEMEALTAVSVASLTLFDMLKAIDRTMVIGGIEVVAKSGGKSGTWRGE